MADVFLTPFQDAPLDLNSFPDFYKNRQAAILLKVAELKRSTDAQLVELVADGWRRHYGTVCRGVNWSAWSLKFLQLVAMSVGGEGLAGIGRTLCVNFRHFSGGLPDLLLMKGARRRRVEGNVGEWDVARPAGGDGAESRASHCGDESRASEWEGVDLDELVGEVSPLLSLTFSLACVLFLSDMRMRAGKARRVADAMGRLIISWQGGIAARGLALDAASQGGGDDELSWLWADAIETQRRKGGRRNSGRRSAAGDGGRAAAAAADASADGGGSASDTASRSDEDASGLSLDEDRYEYRFEAKLVEVKGPNDTLMDRQTAWLAILRSAGIDARVCRVVETPSKLPIKSRGGVDEEESEGKQGREREHRDHDAVDPPRKRCKNEVGLSSAGGIDSQGSVSGECSAGVGATGGDEVAYRSALHGPVRNAGSGPFPQPGRRSFSSGSVLAGASSAAKTAIKGRRLSLRRDKSRDPPASELMLPGDGGAPADNG